MPKSHRLNLFSPDENSLVTIAVDDDVSTFHGDVPIQFNSRIDLTDSSNNIVHQDLTSLISTIQADIMQLGTDLVVANAMSSTFDGTYYLFGGLHLSGSTLTYIPQPLSGIYAPLASPTFTGTVSGISKAMVGLTNVDDTSDTDKPISHATQAALNLKANQSQDILQLTQAEATTITGQYPHFTISSTDTNTTYSAGTGVTLTGTEFSIGQSVGTSNSPEFSSMVIGGKIKISTHHKNYGGANSNVAYMAYKSVYDNNNHAHAFAMLASGSCAINSSGTGAVCITHKNIYYHRFHSNGHVSFGINNSTYRLYVNGTVAYTGLHNASDDRLKHNERTIENGLEILRKLHPKFYQKTNEMKTADHNGPLEDGTWKYEAGLIAQDVDLIPELQYLVTKPEADYDDQLQEYSEVPYALNYQDLFVYNIAATKELDSIVSSQAKVIEEMTTRLAALESRLAQVQSLEARLTAAGL